MAKRNKMEEVYEGLLKIEPEEKEKKKDRMIHANFYIRAEQIEKLKQMAAEVAPRHIKVSISEFVRYLIESCDIEEAKKNFFKIG
ncbi:MAG: hypothetical protein ACYCXB_03565 [Candidatus Humimicrobiaceae bacterium]